MAALSPPTDRVVAVLNALAEQATDPMTVSELARSQGISVATCHAIVASLAASGYLVRAGHSKRYALGPRVVALGQAAQSGLVPSHTASALLSALSQDVGLVCSLRTRVGGHVVVLDSVGEDEKRASAMVGDQYPFAPPFGLSFVLWGSEQTKQEWIAQAPAPPPPDELGRLARVTASSRRQGFAVHERLSETRRRLHAALQTA